MRAGSAEITDAGERFLDAAFGPGWQPTAEADQMCEALLRTPIDNAWVEKRIQCLKPCSDHPVRLIPKAIWNLATALMQSDGWFGVWKVFAARCPREWLVRFCGVAMLTRTGKLRALSNPRAHSMLVLGVLAWELAEYDPAGDTSGGHFPWVVRGLPYRAYQLLLSYSEHYADGIERRVPAGTTIFGTHDADGCFETGGCGYIASWKQADIARTFQPNGFHAPAGMAGPWRYPKPKKGCEPNKKQRQRWAFVELRLRIGAPKDGEPLEVGPPPPRGRGRPGPRRSLGDDLDAAVDRLEATGYAPQPEHALPRACATPPVVAEPQHVGVPSQCEVPALTGWALSDAMAKDILKGLTARQKASSEPPTVPVPPTAATARPAEPRANTSVTTPPAATAKPVEQRAKPAALTDDEWADICSVRRSVAALKPDEADRGRMAGELARTVLEAAEPFKPEASLEDAIQARWRLDDFARAQEDPGFLEAIRKYEEDAAAVPLRPRKPPD